MRHAAASLAFEVNQLQHQAWDAVFATDMLNLAEFRGLAAANLAALPTVLYFHENQFAYPSRGEAVDIERDMHFAFTNLLSLLAADAIWFNSQSNLDSLRSGIQDTLQRMPKLMQPDASRWQARLEQCFATAEIHHPGIEPLQSSSVSEGPLHILWAARWEHDKNPEEFFSALRQLREAQIDIRLSVLGQSYSQTPECFDTARQEFSREIVNWGYASSRAEYRSNLQDADVVVSTAHHEFFGIAIAEAMSAGCIPVLPDRLSYPELVQCDERFLYADQQGALAHRLHHLARMKNSNRSGFAELSMFARQFSLRFDWQKQAGAMDESMERLIRKSTSDHNFRID